MLHFIVEDRRCTRCRQCVAECPSRIIQQGGRALPFIAPEQETLCIHCQHCMAVCPTAALSILGRHPDDSPRVMADLLPTLDQMTMLVRSRRSIRRYRDENVDRALIDRLLSALANAPTGVNRQELTFTVLGDKAVMQRFRERMLAGLSAAFEAGKVPERFTYLQRAVTAWAADRTDVILRGAPHLLVVSAPPDAPCPQQDVALALAYFELMAQSAGLGTVWCGMLSMALAVLPELKDVLGLPANHVYYAMLFGPPAVRFPRTVQRDDGARIRHVTMGG